MIVRLARRISALVAFITIFAVNAYAQSYPVQVNVSLSPPYSPFLADYSAADAQKLTASFFLRDLNVPEYKGKLRLTIEGVGITIRTKANYVPLNPITLYGGETITLFGESLEEYFNPNNLDFAGISRSQYEKGAKLPEGVYRFTLEVLDYNRGTLVSNKGTAVAWIILNSPPILNLPRNDSKAKIIDPLNIPFTWTARHTGSPNAAFSTEYVFRLVEVWPATRNPYDAFLSQQPLYEITTTATQIVYGPAEPALIPGRKYAWQVQAKDTEGRDLFKNDGKSEVYVFQFGDAMSAPQNFRKDAGSNSSVLNLRWEPAPDGAIPEQYRVRYRKKGDTRGVWYENVTQQLWAPIPNLQPETEYEMQIRAEAKPQYSDYSSLQTFRTEVQGAAKYTCGDHDVVAPITNTNPLLALASGEVITVRNFKLLITQVTGSGGNYTGTGWLKVPWFNGAGIRVNFSGPVNTDRILIGGSVESVYNQGSPAAQAIDDANNIGKDTNPFFEKKDSAAATIVKPDYTIPGTIASINVKDDGKITVVDTEGNESTFEPKKDERTGKAKETVIADAAGNSYTVGADGKVTKGPGGSTASSVASSVSSDEDAFMQELIQFYLDEITAYLTANPQYDKGPYYSDEVVKVLEDLPTCLQTRAGDIAYIKRYLKHLQNDQNDRSYFVNLIRKSVAEFGESLIKAVEARNKPGNSNKKLRDLLPIEDWNLVTNGMCEYVVTPAQEYHITTSVEKTFKTEGDCFIRALKRGMEVKTSFDMAAYAALIEVGLCLTEKGNCAGTGYWSQFSCGVANGLVQELDVVAMGEGVATLLITQVKNKYNCIADGDLIDVVVQEPTMEQAVHSYSKCVLGFDMTLDEWKKLYGTVEKYVATNWQDPYLHGQATVFVASLVIPVTKLSKIKLLGKLKINPNFANKIDDLAKLSEAAGDSKKLEKLADELTIVKQADELITISDDAVALGDDLAATAKSYLAKTTRTTGVVDIVVHGSGNTYKIILNGVEYTLDSRGLANWIKSKGYSNNTIRLLSCSGKESAQDIANKLGQKVIATEDVVRLHADGGISTAKNSNWYQFSPGNSTPEVVTKPRPPNKNTESYIELSSTVNQENNLLSSAGRFVDNVLESDYQKYIARKAKAGQTPRGRLEWKEVRDYWLNDSPMARGNRFNKTAELQYDINELNLINKDGSFTRLDSYVPASSSSSSEGMIISRKATDLVDIEESTFRKYLQEMKNKYAPGTRIRSNAYPKLDGKTIEGKLYLQIPENNKLFYDIERYRSIAKNEYGIEIIFLAE